MEINEESCSTKSSTQKNYHLTAGFHSDVEPVYFFFILIVRYFFRNVCPCDLLSLLFADASFIYHDSFHDTIRIQEAGEIQRYPA